MSSSPLVNHILPDLLNIKNPSDRNILYKTSFKMLILFKKDIMYITDGHVIVQAQILRFSQSTLPLKQSHLKPFNIIRTSYYNFQTRYADLFLFTHTDNYLIQIPHVYHPLFHFKQDRIGQYQHRNGRTIFDHCTNKLIAKEWGFKIVNVANTGYYGIVLQIYQYQLINQKGFIHEGIHSILYQRVLAEILEGLRIRDMRQLIGEPQSQNSISLCYYCKNLKSARNYKNYQSNFVNADKSGRFIKVNLQKRQYYIPLGKLNGIQKFLKPLKKFSQSKRTIINFNQFKPQILDKEVQNQDLEQVSSDQQYNQEQNESQDQQNIQQREQSQSEQNEEMDEPLKLIYTKQLQKMNLI